MGKNGQKWAKMGKKGQKGSKMVKPTKCDRQTDTDRDNSPIIYRCLFGSEALKSQESYYFKICINLNSRHLYERIL